VRVIFADHQGDPQKARAEAERLITQEHVVALIGSYQSATAATVSQVADRYEVPFMVAESSSPSLNQRGLKWFFRTSPHDMMFTQAMFDFYRDIGAKTGRKVRSVVLFHEDTIFGTDSSNAQKQMAEAAGIKVAADIRYRGNSPSLSAEVQQIKAADADVVMPTSYTSDAILLMRGMHDLGYTPKAIMAQSAGFAEQSLIDAVGPLMEGVMSRSAFALDAVKARPAIPAVNALFRARSNKDLNDNTGREITALIVLADAINRAGSTDEEKIRQALIATDVPGDQTIMPWQGIKFDNTGQNIAATPVIQQIKDGKYHTIYPFDVAAEEAVWNVGK
jgi:branched-chain amino acid transport system substrate-binding protein